MRRSLRHAALLCALSLSLSPTTASADDPDSDAPPGALPTWLPTDGWVRERWLPFDSARLSRILGLKRPAIHGYLVDGDRTLLDLARERGVPTHNLATRLVAPRRAKVSRKAYRRLLARTRQMMDQGHLAEHMIGHRWHHRAITVNAPEIVGTSTKRYVRLRGRGMSPVQIGETAGRTPVMVRASMLRVLDRAGRKGVSSRSLSPAEAAVLSKIHHKHIDDFIFKSRKSPKGQTYSARSASAALVCDLPN
jgi:hypothetical protein